MTERDRFGVNGSRGAYLLTLGLLHVFVGLYLLTLPPGVEASGIAGPLPFLRELHVQPWMAAVPWWVTAGVAFVCAFVTKPGRDAAGFQALAGMEAAWGTVYAVGWALGARTSAAWLLMVVFWLMSVGVIIVSRMVSAAAALEAVEAPCRGAGES